MDPETFGYLCKILPVELISLIDDALCEEYRKDNSKKIYGILRDNLWSEGGVGFNCTPELQSVTLAWAICDECRELQKGGVYNWFIHAFYNKVPSYLCKCEY
nr:hypothetical protein K-LCC10_0228 [Kaumoebavirus]